MNDFVFKKYEKFIEKNGYIPRMFNPYNISEITDIAPTMSTFCGSTTSSATVLIVEENMIEEPFIVASRGRNPMNPSDRTVGSPTEQRLEPNSQGLCNTLTTVLKDNYVAEPQVLTPKRTEYGKAIRKAYESGEIQESRHNMTELQPRTDGITNTLTTVQKDNYVAEPSLRIRKLTPKECWRLMGFTDDDFAKAEKVNSNTQLYKQAGNSIVVPVLEGILGNLHSCSYL